MAVGTLSFLVLGRSEAGLAAGAEGERLVLAFYYPWYDAATWSSGKVPDLPETLYNSDDRAVMARHVEQAKSAGIDALVVNWWGTENRTDQNLGAMLEVAAQQGFRIAAVFDLNSPTMRGTAGYAANLRHLLTVDAAQAAYLRVDGRPVVFFYNVSRLPVATWAGLREQVDPDHKALWIAEGTDLKYQSVFDGHHLYSITWPNKMSPAQVLTSWGKKVRTYNQKNGTAKLWVATVMPGYDDRKARPGSGFSRSRDGGEYYRQCWQAAIASRPEWVIVNSFNEWPEGTFIEASESYGRQYLDLTAEWAARFRAAGYASVSSTASVAPPAAAKPAPVRPTATPVPVPTAPPPRSQPVPGPRSAPHSAR